jgi:hypothetical protein
VHIVVSLRLVLNVIYLDSNIITSKKGLKLHHNDGYITELLFIAHRLRTRSASDDIFFTCLFLFDEKRLYSCCALFYETVICNNLHYNKFIIQVAGRIYKGYCRLCDNI